MFVAVSILSCLLTANAGALEHRRHSGALHHIAKRACAAHELVDQHEHRDP